ncbi:general substrate transporter [Mycena capillaripes]|nr:general substrate transporter [Mycena capillaripes]
MTLAQPIFKNIRVYWLAFVVYWGIILFGYDTGIAGGVVSAPFFLQEFGLLNSDGSLNKQRNADVSSNVVSVLQAGAFFGALGSAPISAKIGRRFTLLGYTLIFLIGAILTTVANGPVSGLKEIYAGRVILGFGIGGISAVSPAFVSECSPKEVRGRITGLFQIFVAIGVMMSYWVNYGITVHIQPGPKLWTIPFGIQLIPAGIMLLGLLTVKESPRWLASWSGQNSVNYYTPQIFASIGYTGRRNGLLGTGVYGVVKLVATSLFVFFGVEWLGRKASLFISAMGMGTCFFIIGAILKTHPPPATDANSIVADPPPASKAMAAMLYIYVCFYSMGWGPLPWVYCADIFPTRTRHYGMAVASASQWLWNFTLSKTTPQMVLDLGYKIFLMFATVNIGAMAVFALLIPETKGRSLEDMDIIFGAVTQERRDADVAKQERVLDNQKAPDEASDRDEKV